MIGIHKYMTTSEIGDLVQIIRENSLDRMALAERDYQCLLSRCLANDLPVYLRAESPLRSRHFVFCGIRFEKSHTQKP